MKITIHPVRQMQKKAHVRVWVDCDPTEAQAYDLRDKKGKLLRRERSSLEANRIANLFRKPRSSPPKDRSSLWGKRWDDVKDRL